MNELGTGLPPADWDESVLAMQGNFLQSRIWAQFQAELGRPVYYGRGEGWSWCGPLRKARGGWSYLAPSYGPTVTGKQALQSAVENLRSAGSKLGADMVRIEPMGPVSTADLASVGAVAFAEVQPQHTHVLDLTKPIDELRSNLHSGHRNRINGAQRRGISIRQADGPADLDHFLTMLADTARQNKIRTFEPDYYRTMYRVLSAHNAAVLYLAEYDGKPVASAICFDWGLSRYYAHAAAYQAINRKISASVVVVWQMIVDAKNMGKTEFDFWGVAPAGATNHKWAGLSEFKRAYGGVDREYVGTWDLPLHTARYRLYRKLKRFM